MIASLTDINDVWNGIPIASYTDGLLELLKVAVSSCVL